MVDRLKQDHGIASGQLTSMLTTTVPVFNAEKLINNQRIIITFICCTAKSISVEIRAGFWLAFCSTVQVYNENHRRGFLFSKINRRSN